MPQEELGRLLEGIGSHKDGERTPENGSVMALSNAPQMARAVPGWTAASCR